MRTHRQLRSLTLAAMTTCAALLGPAAHARTDDGTVGRPVAEDQAAGPASVDSFVVEKRISPAFGGRTFGAAGAYELIVARMKGSLDPRAAINRRIVALDKAPRNAAGRVEYSTQVTILKPIDLAKGSGNLVYEVINRSIGGIDPRAEDLDRQGIMEVLLPRGDVFINAAWQGELTPERLPPNFGQFRDQLGSDPIFAALPPALEGGKPLVRRIRHDVEAVNVNSGKPMTRISLPYPATPTSRVTAMSRRFESDKPVRVPAKGIRMLDRNTVEVDPVPGAAIYDIFYDATDAVVSGVGFAVPRDLVSFLRNDPGDGRQRANPLVGRDGKPIARQAYAYGLSQSGRYLRMFLWQGFNQDAAGRAVFDGIVPIVAGARFGYMNGLFSDAGQSPSELSGHRIADAFPFAYPVLRDPLSGRTDGVLKRCEESRTCPKVMQIDSEQEAANAWGWLLTTTPDGKAITRQPDNVRLYAVAGSDHGDSTTPAAACRASINAPVSYKAFVRAAFFNLDAWVRHGTLPPPSNYPGLADGGLTTLAKARAQWPAIPGYPYVSARNAPEYFIAGQPLPVRRGGYPILAMTLDADGNATGGLRHPMFAVPTGTMVGVGGRKEGFTPQHSCPFLGEYLPFAATRGERLASGDPRRSMEERYPGGAVEIGAKRRAVAQTLVAQRYILPIDAEAAAAEAPFEVR